MSFTLRIAGTAAVSLFVLLVAALLAGYQAMVQRDEARIQRNRATEQRDIAISRQLAAASEITREHRLDLSLLLSLHALEFKDTPAARSALLKGLQATSGVKLFLPSEVGANRASFSPDGRTLAVQTATSVELRDPETGEVTARLAESEEPQKRRGFITDAAFHPDGRLMAISRHDGTIQLWDVVSGQKRGEFFSGLGDELLPYKTAVDAWSEMDRQAIRAVAFDRRGERFAAVDGAANLFVWEFHDREMKFVYVGALPNLPQGALSVDFLSTGQVLVTSLDGWDVVTLDNNTYYEVKSSFEQQATTKPESSEDALYHLNSRPTISDVIDTWIVVGGTESRSLDPGGGFKDRGVVQVWRLGNEKPRVLLYTGAEQDVSAASLSPDRSRLVAGDAPGRLWVWNPRRRELIEGPIQLHGDRVSDIAFHPTEAWVVSTGGDGSVAVRDLDPAGTTLAPPQVFSPTARSVRFSSDGRFLASGYEDGSLFVWDARSLEQLHRLEASSTAVVAVRFLNGSDGLVTATAGGEIALWTIGSAGELAVRRRFTVENQLEQIALSRDEGMLAAANGGDKIMVFDLQTGQRVQIIEGKEPTDTLAFDRHGTFLLADTSGWRLERHQIARSEAGVSENDKSESLNTGLSGGIQSIELSPDGSQAALGLYSGEILMISLERWEALFAPAPGHDTPVTAVAFSPDGTLLASAGTSAMSNKRLQLWDVATMQRIGDAFPGEDTPVWDIAFSADGTRVALAGGDGTIRLVDVDIESWISRACMLAARELTMVEWNQYVGREIEQISVCIK